HDEGEDDRRPHAHQDAGPPREAEGQNRDRVAVTTDRHEAGLAEVQQAAVTEVDREAESGNRVRDRLRQQQRRESLIENEYEIHEPLTYPLSAPQNALWSEQQNHD